MVKQQGRCFSTYQASWAEAGVAQWSEGEARHWAWTSEVWDPCVYQLPLAELVLFGHKRGCALSWLCAAVFLKDFAGCTLAVRPDLRYFHCLGTAVGLTLSLDPPPLQSNK